jgi:hypothetical protein
MEKKFFVAKAGLVFGLGVIFLSAQVNAFAYDHDRRYDHHKRSRSYRHSPVLLPWFSFRINLGRPCLGDRVIILPFGHRVRHIRGNTYYYYDGVYYQACPSGYIVVPDPVIFAPKVVSDNAITINIPNANGSYTVVTLVRYNNGYLGPQGEYYAQHPTVAQLRGLYGN